jgi:hypothetical protein
MAAGCIYGLSFDPDCPPAECLGCPGMDGCPMRDTEFSGSLGGVSREEEVF